MPYRYLEDIATADAAFEAWGKTPEELFTDAADALMNVMVADLRTIDEVERMVLRLQSDDMEMLLYDLLQELIFYKDAEQLLLRVKTLRITRESDHVALQAETAGEKIDPGKHDLVVDVKAVTFHRYRVEHTSKGWEATVVVDI